MSRRQMQCISELRQRRYTVVRRQRHPYISEADLMSEEVDEIRNLPVRLQSHRTNLRRIRSDLVTENVIRRQTDRQEVGSRPGTQFLIHDQLSGELKLIIVRKRSRADELIKSRRLAFLILSRGSRAEDLTLEILPFPIQVLFRSMALVEILHPIWQLGTIVSRGDPGASLRIDPVSRIARKSSRKYRRAIF